MESTGSHKVWTNSRGSGWGAKGPGYTGDRYARHRLYYNTHSSSKKRLHLGTWGSLREVREMAAASLWMC